VAGDWKGNYLETAAELCSAVGSADPHLGEPGLENRDSNCSAEASMGHSGRHASKIAFIIISIWDRIYGQANFVECG
jgi:hypothetical protein